MMHWKIASIMISCGNLYGRCLEISTVDSSVNMFPPHNKDGIFGETVQHTSASLTINENYDSDVLNDIETWLSTVPEVT